MTNDAYGIAKPKKDHALPKQSPADLKDIFHAVSGSCMDLRDLALIVTATYSVRRKVSREQISDFLEGSSEQNSIRLDPVRRLV